jgi:hypothetical protein
MTADERIEKLLNRFGQTISDLPKANDYKYNRKLIKPIISAEKCVDDWYDPDHSYDFYQYAYPAYICHLCDVIDRMEIALETALTQLEEDCDKCSTYDCQGNCRDNFFLRDELLIDPELEIDEDNADR